MLFPVFIRLAERIEHAFREKKVRRKADYARRTSLWTRAFVEGWPVRWRGNTVESRIFAEAYGPCSFPWERRLRLVAFPADENSTYGFLASRQPLLWSSS